MKTNVYFQLAVLMSPGVKQSEHMPERSLQISSGISLKQQGTGSLNLDIIHNGSTLVQKAND